VSAGSGDPRRARVVEVGWRAGEQLPIRMDAQRVRVPSPKVKELAFFSDPRLARGVFCQAPGDTRFLAKLSSACRMFAPGKRMQAVSVLPTDCEFGETLRPGKTLRAWTPGVGGVCRRAVQSIRIGPPGGGANLAGCGKKGTENRFTVSRVLSRTCQVRFSLRLPAEMRVWRVWRGRTALGSAFLADARAAGPALRPAFFFSSRSVPWLPAFLGRKADSQRPFEALSL
jgi:hypothetical protein